MKGSEHDIEKRQSLEERGVLLDCYKVIEAAKEHLANPTPLHHITDSGFAAPSSRTSDDVARLYTIESILESTAERLEKLLHIWEDCPGQTREILGCGVRQPKEMSTKVVDYKGIKYPCLFFELMCDAYICVLKQGESLVPSTLHTAWNRVQLFIQVVNE
jgi:hypothetical protein